MRTHQSTKAMANNLNDAGLREILQRQDAALRELHGSVKKLGEGSKPSATPIYIGAPPGTGGGETPPVSGVRSVAQYKLLWSGNALPTSPVNFTMSVPNSKVLPVGTYQVIASMQGRGVNATTGTLTMSWANDNIDYSGDVFTNLSVSSGQRGSGWLALSSGGIKALTGSFTYGGTFPHGGTLEVDLIALR
jgi:hypothetical protein